MNSYVKTTSVPKLKFNSEVPKVIKNRFTGRIADTDGCIRYYKNGKLHSENDQPAVTYPTKSTHLFSGSKAWYYNGKRHRDKGPAFLSECGTIKLYLSHGELHRLDGPAGIMPRTSCSDAYVEYRVNGRLYDSDSYPRAVANWLSYKEFTRSEITSLIGNFRIVEWE